MKLASLEHLLDRYWDLAFAEGRDGRATDTVEGEAQDVRHAITGEIKTLEALLRQARRALGDLDLGRSIHNDRFPDKQIRGGVWDNAGRVISEIERALR